MLAAALLVTAAVAFSVPASQTQTYTENFKAKTSNTSTATSFSESSSDPNNTQNNGQPIPANEVDVTFPPGGVLDYTAVPVCTATDNQITQSGGTACPSKTKIGNGTATASLPFQGSQPISVQLTAWNGKKQLIIYVKPSI